MQFYKTTHALPENIDWTLIIYLVGIFNFDEIRNIAYVIDSFSSCHELY